MDKLDKLREDIEKKQEKKHQAEVLENLKIIADKLSGKEVNVENKIEIKEITEKLDELIKKEPIKIEEKKIVFPKSFDVSNLGDIKFPEQKEIKIPEQKEFPKEITVKEPKWLDFKWLKQEFQEIKLTIIKQLSFDPDKYKKKSNALAVRLVTKDGGDFYNAGGGGGSSPSGIDTSSIATEETLQAMNYAEAYGKAVESGSYYYWGYLQTGGTNWRIKRLHSTTYAVGWATGSSGLAAAWADKENQSFNSTL